MNITKTITLCLVLAATTAVVSGQAAYVLRTPAAAESEGFYLPSAQYPSGADSTVAHVPTFNLPNFFSGAVAPPAGSGQGGHTVNQNTNRMLSTDGFHLWEEPHPRYPDPGFVPSAPVPVGIFAGVIPRIMGLGIDTAGNGLWMCNITNFQRFSATYPYSAMGGVVWPSFVVNGVFTGIAYDPSTQSLWLCTNTGRVYNCDQGGFPIGPQPVSAPWNSLTGIAVNTTNGLGSFPAPSCSAQIGGFHIMVTEGSFLIDALSGAAIALGNPSDNYGLAFSADGQYSDGGSPWVGSGVIPAIRIPRPFNNGVGSIPAQLGGARPGAPAYLLYGLCPLGTPIPLGLGSVRVLSGYVPRIVDSSGRASVGLPVSAAPAGLQFTLQWAFYDPLQPSGWALTDAMTLTLGLQ